MELPKKLKELSNDLEKWINVEEITTIAIESGYELQESPLRGINFFLIHLLGAMDKGMGSSLTELCTQATHLGIHIAKESLDDRYTEKASRFMRRVCQHLMNKRLGQDVHLQTLSSFEGVYISDATIVELPSQLSETYKGTSGKSSSLLKLDCTFDLKSSWSRMQIKSGAGSDQTLIFGAPKKSIWIRDLGYYRVADLENLNKQEAFFISKARMDVPLYLKEKGKEQIDLVEQLNKMDENEYKEFDVTLGLRERLPVRLVLQKLPEKLAEKKRKELIAKKRKKSRKVSKRRIALCGLNAYITNLQQEDWRTKQVHLLYKIRWQIELIFKIWKSQLNLDKVHKMKQHRFECFLYAFLIYIILNHKLIQGLKNYYWNEKGIELSEIKLTKILKTRISDLKRIFIGMYSHAIDLFEVLFKMIKRHGIKQVRYRNKNPLFHIS